MAGRKTFHWDSKLGKLVEGPSPPRIQRSEGIIPDIEPFVSPIDKSVIGSRPQLEAHNRRHGVTNSADYPKDWVAKRGKSILRKQDQDSKRQRKELIIKAMHQLDRG